jgi:AraC-like DNA-binding protein
MAERKHIVIDPDYAALASSISQLQIQNLQSDVLQYQSISAPYAFVLETFDPAQQTGTVEILDEQRHQILALGKKEYRLFQKRRSHSHAYLELMVVLSGSIRNLVEGEAFIYQRGQGCLMNPQIHHQEEPITQAEVLFVALRREFLAELLHALKEEKTSLRGATLTAFLQEVLEEQNVGSFHKRYLDFSPFGSIDSAVSGHSLLCVSAVEALRKKRPGCGFLARAAILGFLNDLGDASLYTLLSTASALSHQEFLAAKIDLLIRASHGGVRIRELEEQLAYNGDYLNRLYRQQKGVSISESCRQVRIQDAAYLLRHTTWSIDKIMQELGVTSRGHFFSQFQEMEDMTPKEYRKAHMDSKKGLS